MLTADLTCTNHPRRGAPSAPAVRALVIMSGTSRPLPGATDWCTTARGGDGLSAALSPPLPSLCGSGSCTGDVTLSSQSALLQHRPGSILSLVQPASAAVITLSPSLPPRRRFTAAASERWCYSALAATSLQLVLLRYATTTLMLLTGARPLPPPDTGASLLLD